IRNAGGTLAVGPGAQEEQEPRKRLCVLDLAETPLDLVDSPLHDLDMLVVVGIGSARFDALCEKQVHVLAAEARRRPERAELAPGAPGQPALLLQLPLRGRERLFALFARAGGKLDEL